MLIQTTFDCFQVISITDKIGIPYITFISIYIWVKYVSDHFPRFPKQI